jgi:hypothetical protein
MNDLIDRYVHQVGLYVRPKERADIEAELRSQIHDQLEDRFGGAPSREDVAAVLRQLGDPRTMAASYSGERYLVGPALYPFLETVLRFGLTLVPAVVVIANIVGAALSPDGANWPGLLVSAVFSAAQFALLFFAVVVIIFAIIERSGEQMRAAAGPGFDPLSLPAVDDPGAVDRVESGVGIAFGLLAGIAMLYFVQVGGLTLRLNLSDPGEVLPAPAGWMVVLMLAAFGNVVFNLWALVRRRWSLVTWLIQTALDLTGTVAVYFVLLMPVAGRIAQSSPGLADSLPLEELPAIITLVTIILIAFVSGFRLIRLWQARQEVRR